MHTLNVYSNLSAFNDKNPYKIVEKNIGIGAEGIEVEEVEKGIRHGINDFLLISLRKRVPYYLTLHREKHRLDSNRITVIGGGTSGVNYHICVRDRYDRAFIQLRFSESKKVIYDELRGKEYEIKKDIEEPLEFEDKINSISFYVDDTKDIKKTIDRITKVFEKYILNFTNYTHYTTRTRTNGRNIKGIV